MEELLSTQEAYYALLSFTCLKRFSQQDSVSTTPLLGIGPRVSHCSLNTIKNFWMLPCHKASNPC